MGSGTAVGLPLKLAAGANVRPNPLEPVPNQVLSAANRPEPVSARVETLVEGRIDEVGNAASTRLSSRLASRPGSVAASRSIAAMRFSNR